MTVGKYLRHIRVDYDLSQQQLAEMCGVSRSELSCVEKGKLRMPPKMYKYLCAAMLTEYKENIKDELMTLIEEEFMTWIKTEYSI